NLTRLVSQVDGSIGYSDLATARGLGFDVAPDATRARQDYTFWSPLQVDPGNGGTLYAEPTAEPTAHLTTITTKGAACARAPVPTAPVPASSPAGAPTQGDWSTTYAVGGPAYPGCVVTYLEAWDDNAPVYGNTADEQAMARTVKDYLQKIVVST